MAPIVSAIVPAYNAERFLAEALDSALAQTLQDIEVIVVDDGSADSTGAIADRYAALHPGHVRVVHQANGGLVAARNAAIEAARGRYLALLDADDAWLPHHLAASTEVLDQHEEIGLVHANIECMDAGSGSLGRYGATRRRRHFQGDAFTRILLRRGNVACPTAVFRRSLVEQVGPFDPVFNRLGCEDRDMWLRIAKVTGLRHLDSVHARYRIHDTNMSANLERMRKARLLLVERHTSDGPGRPLRRKAIAAVHNLEAVELFYAGRRLRALGAYSRALGWNPFDGATWRGMAVCLVRPQPRLWIDPAVAGD